jgi:membrane-bound lytic murein transglycosylase D
MLRKQLKFAGFLVFAAFAAFTAGTSSAAASSTGPKQPTLIRGISFVPNVAGTAAAEPSTGDSIRSTETDARLALCDSHFNLGRQAYFKGDYATAHREFDEAVNTLLTAPDSLPDRRRVERRLSEISDVIYRFDVEKLGAGQTEDASVVYDKAPIDEISHMTFPVDPKLTPKLEGELHHTASGIPLELADPVQSFVHYFSTPNGRDTLLTGFRRAGRYRAMIERIFAEEGVPQELIYLAQAESAFLPRSVSNKQAVGMWQFIGETGATYKLNRTTASDDRLDPEKSTRAAARYLKDLYHRYGDWYLAMAAYNCGAGNVDRAVERTGYADYWKLLKLHALPKETSNYVPIILAITIMAKNPEDYGLQSIDTDPAIEYDTIHVTAKTNLNLVADATMQPVSTIRDLNPAILGSAAPEGYDVHIPKGTADTATTALESVPAANRAAWRLHHVTANDTLETIARAYNTAPERIIAVNNQQAANLTEGDTLLIPAEYHPDVTAVNSTRSSKSRARSKTHGHPSNSRAARVNVLEHGTHVAAARRVSSPLLHRKAAVHTAGLRH